MTTFNFGLGVRYPSCLERVWTTICIWVQGRIYPSNFWDSEKKKSDSGICYPAYLFRIGFVTDHAFSFYLD